MDKLKCLEILGLKENPSEDEVKAAYRKLAKQWHPDKNPDDPNAKYKFNEVHQAMKTLLEEEEDITEIYDAFEMYKKIILEFHMKNYFCRNMYRYSFCSDEEDMFSSDFCSLDSDEDDDEFLDLLNERRGYTDMNDDPRKDEARDFTCFNEWKKAQNEKRKQKIKESAPVRPKQLKKKQQEHLDYQRERESAKIREELMTQMEQKRIKEEKRLQKDEQKRRELQAEMQRNLEETVARTEVYTKVEAPKPQVSFKKPKSKAKTKREKLKVHLTSTSSEDNQEATSNVVYVKNEGCWDSEETSLFINNLPTSEKLKEERQSKLGDILRKARGMRCVEEWSVSPEEPLQQETSFWDSEDAPSFQCPTLISGTHKKLCNGVDKCEEWGASSEGPQCQRVSPSFWDSEDESTPRSPSLQSFNENELSSQERMRYNEIQKLRELEQRRNSRERDEIRAVESFHRRQTAMEKRQMETSHVKDSKFSPRSTSYNHSPTSNVWDKKFRAEEKDDPAWDACKPTPPTENVWNKRMAVQNQHQEIIPSTVDDEEAMLQKAIQLSHIQYVEDEKTRFKIFEEGIQGESVPIATSQGPSETRTSSDLDYIPNILSDFTNPGPVSRSDSASISQDEDDLVPFESSSSDTNNELEAASDASTLEKRSVVDENEELKHFLSDRFSTREDIDKPVNRFEEEASFSHPQVNLNSTKLSSSRVQVDLEPTSSHLHPPVDVEQHSFPSKTFAKVVKPVSAAPHEETSSYLQANTASEDISKLSHQAVNKQHSSFSNENVIEYSSSNSQKNNYESALIYPQTSANLQLTPGFHVVNSDRVPSVNLSQAITSSELTHPFSEPKETSSHITDEDFEKDFEATKHDMGSSNTQATMDLRRSSPPVINCAVPPFPKLAATPSSVRSTLSPPVLQQPVNHMEMLENSTSLLGTLNSHHTKLPSVDDAPLPVSANFDTSCTYSASGHEEQASPSTGILGNSSHPSAGFTMYPPPLTEFLTLTENQNYFNVSTLGPSAYVPSASGFPLFPSIPTTSGLPPNHVMPNNRFPPLPFAFPMPTQLGANGFLGPLPQMYAPCSPFVNNWYSSCLPPSYRKLMELPPDTPTVNNPFTDTFLPNQHCPNPYAAAMSNSFPAAFLPTQNCSNPNTQTMNNSFPATFPLMQNGSNPDRVYTNDRPAEPRATVPDSCDLDSCQQPLVSCGRGRGINSRSHETKNVGVDQERVKVDGESLLGPPPKDVRLRKRWAKQIEALSKGLTTSNT